MSHRVRHTVLLLALLPVTIAAVLMHACVLFLYALYMTRRLVLDVTRIDLFLFLRLPHVTTPF